LAKAGHTIVFTGSAGERERALRISREAGLSDASVLAGGLSLAEFAAVIADARLVVSADTGAAHLASAYHRPSVVLFGPARPDEWGPPPGPHIVLERPERRRGDPFADDPDPALLGVSVGDVLDAAARLDFPESGLSRRC
jgi:ADP-heptose:LPS heptosyltransferase